MITFRLAKRTLIRLENRGEPSKARLRLFIVRLGSGGIWLNNKKGYKLFQRLLFNCLTLYKSLYVKDTYEFVHGEIVSSKQPAILNYTTKSSIQTT